MSSYRRPCRECGQRISLRQMPAGQWVAFDVSTEEPHICGIQNKPDVSVKIKGKKKKKFEEDDSIDLGYDTSNLQVEEDEDFEDISEENKAYDTTSGIHKCIDKSIKEKKRILIDYYSEHNEENTQREISPIKKFRFKNRSYLQAYCHKRKGERNFLTRRIETASEVDKKITKIKLGKPKTKFLEKQSEKGDDEGDVYKSTKVSRGNVTRETIPEIDTSSQTPGWVYIVIFIILMGLARGLLIPLMD